MPLMKPEELSLRVKKMLDDAGVAYRVIEHPAEGRCEEVSRLRGNDPREAIKAVLIVLKISTKRSERALALLPGDANIDFDKLISTLKIRSSGMAVASDVRNLLDSEPGGVSPFSFNEKVSVLIDEVLLTGKNVYFSAGRKDESLTMSVEEFKQVSFARGAKVLSFCLLPCAAARSGFFLLPREGAAVGDATSAAQETGGVDAATEHKDLSAGPG